jgi:hypothetical protein
VAVVTDIEAMGTILFWIKVQFGILPRVAERTTEAYELPYKITAGTQEVAGAAVLRCEGSQVGFAATDGTIAAAPGGLIHQ